MAVHLIIDGYNVLGRTGNFSGDLESARETLVAALGAYRHRKNYPITVVFDGWQQHSPIEHREHRSGLQIIYSKRGERADQVIDRLAREHGSGCAVVSSDREVAQSAQLSGAFVIGAQEFAAKLWTHSSGGGFAQKELAEQEQETLPRDRKKKGNPRKLSKALRQRRMRLNRF